MGAISETFQVLRAKGKRALIPFLTCGDPDLQTSGACIRTLAAAGADVIEVGVPYSDPLADGPVIQAAANRALHQGVTLGQVLALLQDITKDIRTPIVLFAYYNLVLSLGHEAFLGAVQQAGVKGLVIPDLPLEEAATLLALTPKYGVELVLLVAPTSPPERIVRIAQQAQGFIYVVSLTGTTGVREQLSALLPERIQALRAMTDKPIAVGFGIATPEQAQQVAAWGADGVIVGSACVRLIAQTPAPILQASLAEFCTSLRSALDAAD